MSGRKTYSKVVAGKRVTVEVPSDLDPADVMAELEDSMIEEMQEGWDPDLHDAAADIEKFYDRDEYRVIFTIEGEA